MTDRDQPRPDLDASIDAVLPSLTAVSDDAVAASLRRTRIALADAPPSRANSSAWRWAAPVVVMTVAGLVVSLWLPSSRVEAPRVATVESPEAPASPRPTTPAPRRPAAPQGTPRPPERVVSGEPVAPRQDRRRDVAVRATSVPDVALVAPRPDPLVALVRAVQRIPEDAWQRSEALAAGPMSVSDVSSPPIDVAPLETPPIADASVGPLAPGEP